MHERVKIYIHEDIPGKLLNKHVFEYDIESLFVAWLNSSLGNVNGYFLEHTIHHPKQILIILII